MFDLFADEKNDKAMLYYLYMMSDGCVSYSEEKLFDEIYKELRLETDEKNMVISKCNELGKSSKKIFNVILKENIAETLSKRWYLNGHGSRLAKIIWNLINLGYADGEYSENEKEIVSYFVTTWKISPDVYQEMLDTADTMLALTKQKEWIVNSFPKGKERDSKEKNIDVAITKLLSDIKITIDEITM